MNRQEIVAITICRYCGAQAGEHCKRKDGSPYSGWYIHAARDLPFRQTWQEGFDAALASLMKHDKAKQQPNREKE